MDQRIILKIHCLFSLIKDNSCNICAGICFVGERASKSGLKYSKFSRFLFIKNPFFPDSMENIFFLGGIILLIPHILCWKIS